MAVPSSGALGLYSDIGVELGVPQSNVSLGAMSDSAGFSAPDAMSDFYGYVDAIAPSVITNAINSIGTNSLRANGNVTSDGGGTITERGFYIGTNSASPTNNTKYTVGGTTGAYSYNLGGLSSGTTYYAWAFATNVVGTTYGSRVNAATIVPYVPNWYAANSNGAIAGVNYNPDSDGYENAYVYYLNPNTGGYVMYKYTPPFGFDAFDSYDYSMRNFYTVSSSGMPGYFAYARGTRTLVQHTMTVPGGIKNYPPTGERSYAVIKDFNGLYSPAGADTGSLQYGTTFSPNVLQETPTLNSYGQSRNWTVEADNGQAAGYTSLYMYMSFVTI